MDEKLLGIAYGATYFFQNSLVALMPLITGLVHDRTKGYKFGYFWTEIILAGTVLIGIIITIAVIIVDYRTGKRLSKPGTKRE